MQVLSTLSLSNIHRVLQKLDDSTWGSVSVVEHFAKQARGLRSNPSAVKINK